MMQGFAMQGQTLSIEGSQAQLLAKLDWFVRDHLFVWSEQAGQQHSLAAWGQWLKGIIEQVFAPEDYEVQSLLATVAQLQQVAVTQHTRHYPLATITTWLDAAITERKTSQGFMAGQLTFFSMLPMRSIPFKLVAVLGLNDGEFPRQDKRPSFDLMANDFQLGDRSVRVDDRYQFLEVLLAARHTLYLSYVGQSQKTNQVIPPSVVVQELFDELGVDATKNTQRYPLQPFGRQYFAPDSELYTFDESVKTSAAAIHHNHQNSAWLTLPLSMPAYTQTDIDINDFLAFAKSPYQWFINKRLGIRLKGVDTLTPGHEVFSLDTLSRYQIEQEIFAQIIAGQATADIHQQLTESGRWMDGRLGELRLSHTIAKIMPVAEHVLGLQMDFTPQPLAIDTHFGHYRVVGDIADHYGASFIMARFATLKPKDFIPAALVSGLTKQPVYLFGKDKDNRTDMRVFDACELPVQQWLKAYVDAHTAPLDYLPELGWMWLEKYHGTQISKKPEEERQLSARNGAATVFKDMLGQGFNEWMQNDNFKRLTEGQTFADVWCTKTQHNSVTLLSDIFHAVKEKRS
jgi:exodeoxyribonuclease V gamma subunit